ncbi:uncharacterized protein CBL_14012, partial [Carabus blaptoides fortunei]
MSENILKQCDDIRPGLLHSKGLKRAHELKKKQERSVIKPLRVLEDEKREAGLNAKLPESNKGFELLKKMGYKPGIGIGKSEAGPSNPLNIVKKSNRLGLGFANKTKQETPPPETSTDDFRARLKRKREMSDLKHTYSKLQRMCFVYDDSDLIGKPLYKWFWPDKGSSDSATDSNSDEDEEKKPEILDSLELERRNHCIGEYLREKYLYCQFCQSMFCDDNDMNKNCPGPTKEDHEETPCSVSPTSDSD